LDIHEAFMAAARVPMLVPMPVAVFAPVLIPILAPALVPMLAPLPATVAAIVVVQLHDELAVAGIVVPREGRLVAAPPSGPALVVNEVAVEVIAHGRVDVVHAEQELVHEIGYGFVLGGGN